MPRLDTIFDSLRTGKRKALMPFLCGGYPGPGTVAAALPELERAGASVVEIGIPISDPIADGPVIAAAMHQAIAKGCTPGAVADEVRRAREAGCTLGIVAMVSVSIVWRIGRDKFFRQLADAGFDGLILPDLVAEDSEPWRNTARDCGLTTSLLIAPTTSPQRAAAIAKACSGFVYVLTRTGITGTSAPAGQSMTGSVIAERVRELRRVTDLPLACGFGIGTPEQVAQVAHEGGADAAIVGSALVKRMGEAGSDAAATAGTFCRELAAGLTPPGNRQ